MNRIRVAGGVVVGGTLAIVVLTQLDFLGLFEPELDPWQQPIARELVQPQGDPLHIEDLEAFISVREGQLGDLFKEGPPVYLQAQADSWAAELSPIVERVCGRAFKAPPMLQVVDRPTLAAALSGRVREQYEGFLPALPEAYLDRLFRALAAWESVALLGVYDHVDDVLYVVPSNVRAVLAAFDLDERHFEPFVKLVVAHELTHALQDQEIDLTSPPPWGHTPDGWQAYEATVEGHAVFVQELVGSALGIDDTSVEISRMLAAGAVPVEAPWLADVSRTVAVLFEEIYLGGRDFIAHHHGATGMDGVWGILAAPPPQTSMITSPGTYAPEPRRGAECLEALRGIEKAFGAGWKTRHSERLNAFDLHGMYASLDGTRRDRLVASIEHMYVATLSRWPDDGNATLYVTVLRNVEAYDETLGSLTALHEDAGGDGPASTALHVRRDRLVVDLHTVDSGLGREDHARIVEFLLETIQAVADY